MHGLGNSLAHAITYSLALTTKLLTATCAAARADRVVALASGTGGMWIASGTYSRCITGPLGQVIFAN
jgi:hypothetical protein